MKSLRINWICSHPGSCRFWCTPRLRNGAFVLALLLPGSFMVLPLLWLWRRTSAKHA
jgi:hypothetical protein